MFVQWWQSSKKWEVDFNFKAVTTQEVNAALKVVAKFVFIKMTQTQS